MGCGEVDSALKRKGWAGGTGLGESEAQVLLEQETVPSRIQLVSTEPNSEQTPCWARQGRRCSLVMCPVRWAEYPVWTLARNPEGGGPAWRSTCPVMGPGWSRRIILFGWGFCF